MKKRIILMGVPYHGNIGDSAIYYAEKKFIEDHFKEYELHHISERGLLKCIDKIKEYCTKEDIIFLHGGGNIGNLYLWSEQGRRNVIEKFPDNKIIVFPQTIYFEENEKGRKELEITKSVYNKHKNLTLIAREEQSYKTMLREFPNCNVIMTPDIVTYLKEDQLEKRTERLGALLILRNDREINLQEQDYKKIENIVKDYFTKIDYSDTHLRCDKAVEYNARVEIIENKFQEFRKAELVITDRLHGMIFSAITATPCIALGNNNHKIKSSVKWFEHLKYIKYAESIDEIDNYILQLKELKGIKYDNAFAEEKFRNIINIVKK